jgi:hypothetical protein
MVKFKLGIGIVAELDINIPSLAFICAMLGLQTDTKVFLEKSDIEHTRVKGSHIKLSFLIHGFIFKL